MRTARPFLVASLVLVGGVLVATLIASHERPSETERTDVSMPSRPERLNEARGDVGALPAGPATVDTDLIVPGGPPPDGIPPIDEPKFVDPAEVRWLVAQEPVISVEVNGEAKAYPIRILMWHEIVNDTIGGEPVTVTYCPLCNTGIAFRRPTIDGALLDFGTSGRLFHSNLVMYDRQTGTYWSQATLEAIVGPLAGRRLEFLPAQIVSWGDWRAAHPSGRVLSQDTGFDRAYGQNPYQGYDSPGNDDPFLFAGDPDPRLHATAHVLGVDASGRQVAFPYEELARQAVDGFSAAQTRVGGQDVVVFWKQGTASALDQPKIAASRDVGSATAYEPRSGDLLLHFEPAPGGFVDQETHSRWDLFGRAVQGPLRGAQLRALPAVDHFWFSWAAFFPDTEIYRS
ncbi:MAG: DUF3179 domain-containing protein [Actinomycetota bacterium]